MATLSYDAIFSSFLGNVTAYNLANLPDNEMADAMIEYLKKTVADPYVGHLFETVEFDDDEYIFTYTLETEVNETMDQLFVLDILGEGMALQWVAPQIQSEQYTIQLFSGKETKWYAQSTQLSTLLSLQSDMKVALRGKIRDRGYINNSYLSSTTGGS